MADAATATEIVMAGWEKPIGAAIAFAAGAIGTAWAQSRIGAAGAGTIAEKPETSGSIIVLEAIPETLVILGFCGRFNDYHHAVTGTCRDHLSNIIPVSGKSP